MSGGADTALRERAARVIPGGLWGQMAFEPEPKIRTDGNSPYAWCQPGGYFMQGQTGFVPMDEKETLFPMRLDTIYYTLRFVLYMTGVERAYAIVHELCHFVALQHVENVGVSGVRYPDPRDDTTPGASNLMTSGTALTAAQAFALSRSALLTTP